MSRRYLVCAVLIILKYLERKVPSDTDFYLKVLNYFLNTRFSGKWWSYLCTKITSFGHMPGSSFIRFVQNIGRRRGRGYQVLDVSSGCVRERERERDCDVTAPPLCVARSDSDNGVISTSATYCISCYHIYRCTRVDIRSTKYDKSVQSKVSLSSNSFY